MKRLAVAALLATACGGASVKHEVVIVATGASLAATVGCGLAGTEKTETANAHRFGWRACIVLGGITTAGGLVLLDAEAREQQGVIDHDGTPSD